MYSTKNSENFEKKSSSQLELVKISLFQVKIEDGGEPPLSNSLSITIIVRDINDNAPYFEHNFYNITVPENEVRGTPLITVKAIDHDNDDKIVYRIERADKDIFTLIHSTDQVFFP